METPSWPLFSASPLRQTCNPACGSGARGRGAFWFRSGDRHNPPECGERCNGDVSDKRGTGLATLSSLPHTFSPAMNSSMAWLTVPLYAQIDDAPDSCHRERPATDNPT